LKESLDQADAARVPAIFFELLIAAEFDMRSAEGLFS
jgi:hypothetical protein